MKKLNELKIYDSKQKHYSYLLWITYSIILIILFTCYIVRDIRLGQIVPEDYILTATLFILPYLHNYLNKLIIRKMFEYEQYSIDETVEKWKSNARTFNEGSCDNITDEVLRLKYKIADLEAELIITKKQLLNNIALTNVLKNI